jgi:hypothetical protein
MHERRTGTSLNVAGKLTPQQLKFVQSILSGMNPSAAYRAAYDAARMSPKAISVEAARLKRRPSVSLAILDGEVQQMEQNTVRGANLRAWTRLREEANDFDRGSPASRVASLRVLAESNEVNLVGQSAKPVDDLSPEEVREELKRMIVELFAEPENVIEAAAEPRSPLDQEAPSRLN